MRAYVAHNMDGNEDLLANLETTKNEVVATRKLVEERVGPLRKTKEEKDVAQFEACHLAEENEVLAVNKKKAKEEADWLRQELQDLRVGFVAQKKVLEADCQKQVDNMSFYCYRCYMKKHGIT